LRKSAPPRWNTTTTTLPVGRLAPVAAWAAVAGTVMAAAPATA